MKQLLLATHNRDKAKEFQAMFADQEIEVITLDAFPHIGETVEDGETLEENALKKAREAHAVAGIPVMADDTGLEVFYLNKAPGVYSARYAGPDATYEDNVKKLLQAMRGVPPRRRDAQFRCVLALVGWAEREIVVEGVCPGVITEKPRGTKGFGYDPIFLPVGQDKTFAEMDPSLKNSVSHRGNALRNMVEVMRTGNPIQ